MNFFNAFILSVVEGLTEFVPVSSTGHMILVSEWLRLTDDKVKIFEIFIQFGAILAVVGFYYQKFFNLLDFSKTNSQQKNMCGWSGLFKIGLTTFPALLFGFLLHDFIKEHLFSGKVVVLGLFLGALLMLVAEKISFKNKEEEITYSRSLFFGLFQCLALFPGMSRSASTISGGLFLGLSRKSAADYSFFVAVPVICAAVFYDLYKNFALLNFSDFPIFIFGFFVSFFVALFSIKFFIEKLNSWTLRPFAYYRLILASVLVIKFLLFK